MYISAAQMMDRFDAQELAQAGALESLVVPSAEVMRAVILEQDTSAFDPDEVAAAEAALERVEAAIADAQQEVDGYLGRRYPGQLPITPTPTLLRRITGNVARYNLHDDEATDEIRARYKDAIRMLKEIAEGDLSLGIDDPSPAGSAGPKGVKSDQDRTFSGDSLHDFVNP